MTVVRMVPKTLVLGARRAVSTTVRTSASAGESAIKVQRRFDGLVAAITRHRARAGSLAGAIEHFGKVTRSRHAAHHRV